MWSHIPPESRTPWVPCVEGRPSSTCCVQGAILSGRDGAEEKGTRSWPWAMTAGGDGDGADWRSGGATGCAGRGPGAGPGRGK